MRCLVGIVLLVGTAAADPGPELPPVLGVTVTATSTLKRTEPWFVVGGDPKKLWCEGGADDGTGDALTITLAPAAPVESLTIRAGVWQSPELFASHNRITEPTVTTHGGK